MTKKRVVLTFASDSISEPVIYALGQQFNIVTNIYRTNAEEDKGWIEVELDGEEDDIEAGIAWAISKGVRVNPATDEIPGSY